MLRRLKVENYALIDRLELELDDRLNIITGETGAGKSILLGALGLLLGNKNDNATLKDDKRNCLIEGVFDLGTRDLQAFFDRNDLDYSRETTLTRQITPAGKSRSFINDTPVPLALLRELGSQLIDIHSQHQNLILGSEAFRTQAVDTVAENHDLRMQYTTLYERLCHLRRELARLREEAEAGRKDEEWLRYQVEELAAAHLKEGEQTELEQELEVLSNADRISETLTALRNALDDEQIGVLVQLKASETACRHLEAGYPFAAEAAGRLRSVLEELKDLGASAAAQSERLDADPERLQKIGDRLNTIYSLCQKHRAADLGELLAKQTDYEARLQAITHGDEAIAAVATELTATEEKAEELARNIHATREKAAPTFNDAIQTTLARLGMPEARFVVQLTPAPALTPTGDDEIDFLFTANGNFAPQKVERIASGGEISRVMLALKALLAHRMELPTIIFDEIDTGVSPPPRPGGADYRNRQNAIGQPNHGSRTRTGSYPAQTISTRHTKESMKLKDLAFIGAVVLLLAPFFLSNDLYAAYLACNASHPYLMALLKFGILSTAGEVIGLRIKTGRYNEPGFGILPHAVVWGFLGVWIAAMMKTLSIGVPAVAESFGIEGVAAAMKGELTPLKFIGALLISLTMNTTFAPVFMTLHKITDTHILNNGGSLRALVRPIPMRRIISSLNWEVQWGFVFKKTIPFFWIPAHTITFLLAPQYQVLFAALLGVMLGILLSVAAVAGRK